MPRLTRVIDLLPGDAFKFVNTILVVRTIEKGRVIATKETAQWPYGQISISFSSANYPDLYNRVETVERRITNA